MCRTFLRVRCADLCSGYDVPTFLTCAGYDVPNFSKGTMCRSFCRVRYADSRLQGTMYVPAFVESQCSENHRLVHHHSSPSNIKQIKTNSYTNMAWHSSVELLSVPCKHSSLSSSSRSYQHGPGPVPQVIQKSLNSHPKGDPKNRPK